MKRLFWILLVTLLYHGQVAAAPQEHAAIRDAAQAYAVAQTRALPGQVSISTGRIDSRLNLAACTDLQAYLPGGAKLQGNTSIAVHCSAPSNWTVLVPVQIKVTTGLLVAARPLAMGSTLRETDFIMQRGEMDRPGLLTQPQQAVGMILRYPIAAGQILRRDMLRAPWLIRQGQTVVLAVQGSGYTINREGQALNDAGAGAAVRIRLASGQVMNARAADNGVAELMR